VISMDVMVSSSLQFHAIQATWFLQLGNVKVPEFKS